MRRLTLVAILGFGILLLFGCGEKQASITGVVTDGESGNPLRDAIVTLEEHTSKTGADGHYQLDKVPLGSYTLTARIEGYKPYQRQIDVQGSQEIILDITLSLFEEPSLLSVADVEQVPHRVIERLSSAISPDEGGSITVTEAESIYSNGFTLSIPPGALEEETIVTVGDVTDDFPPIPNGLRPVGLPVSLQPHGLSFQRSVTVMVPYSREMLSYAGVTSPEDLLLQTYDLSTNEWTDVPIIQVDTQNSVIVAEIDHFSLFSLFSWWNRKETEDPATDEQILTYISNSWGVVAAVDDLARWNANTGIPFKDEIGGILTVVAMAEQIQNEKYRKAAITGGEWLAWQALKTAGYGWLSPFALLVEVTYKGGVWFVKELDEGAFNAQICAYLYYRQEEYSVEDIKDLFVTDDGWVLTAMGTGCPPGYPRLTGRFEPEDVFRIGRAIWDAKRSGSYKERDTESIRVAFIDAIRPVEPNQPPQVHIISPSEKANVTAGEVVNLEGTAADPEDGPLTGSSLTWRRIEPAGSSTFLGEGETLSLSNMTVGSYKISLTATDSQGKTAEDSIEITVEKAANMPPEVTIVTPSDGAIFVEGDSILFTGSAIDPEDGPLADRSLVWVSGIDGPLGPGHTVTRDDLSLGTHAITLSATDSHSMFSTKTITITIEPSTPNGPPTADAGPDQTVYVGTIVTLDGRGSYDPDQDPLRFEWTQITGPPVNFSDPYSIAPIFTPNKESIYRFQLIVGDGRLESSPDHVAIDVVQEEIATDVPQGEVQGIDWLVVWKEKRGESYDIYGSRIDCEGRVMDPDGFAISRASGDQGNPAVMFGMTSWLVLWEDERKEETAIYGARVARTGELLDPDGFLISPGGAFSVAFDGENWVVVWEDAREMAVYFCRITPAGEVLDPGARLLIPSDWGAVDLAIAYGNENALVIWSTGDAGDCDLYAIRVDKFGQWLDTTPHCICDAYNDQSEPLLAFNGSNWFASWVDQRDERGTFIYGARINQSTEVLDRHGILLARGLQEWPSGIASNGDGWLVMWPARDYHSGVGTEYPVYALLIGSSGSVIKTIPVATSIEQLSGSSVTAYNGESYLVVWTENPENDYGVGYVCGRRISGSGDVLDEEVTAIASRGIFGYFPAVASQWRIVSSVRPSPEAKEVPDDHALAPGDVVREYWLLVAQSQYEEALGYVAPGARMQAQLDMTLAMALDAYGRGVLDVYVCTLQIENENATVKATLHLNDGTTKIVENQLQKMQGHWRITGSSSK